MLDEAFMREIPDELPADTDPATKALHGDLRTMVQALAQERQQAYEDDKVVLPQNDPGMLAVRLKMLISEVLGDDTEDRFLFEMKWVDVYSQNIKAACQQKRAAILEARRPKLVVPN